MPVSPVVTLGQQQLGEEVLVRQLLLARHRRRFLEDSPDGRQPKPVTGQLDRGRRGLGGSARVGESQVGPGSARHNGATSTCHSQAFVRRKLWALLASPQPLNPTPGELIPRRRGREAFLGLT